MTKFYVNFTKTYEVQQDHKKTDFREQTDSKIHSKLGAVNQTTSENTCGIILIHTISQQ